MESPDLTGPVRLPQAGGPPDSLIVLLHGVGADGADLIDLADHWSHALPGTLFLAPDAPFACDMAPFGRQWFSLQDRSPAALWDGVTRATPILSQFLDRQRVRLGLPWSRVALVGFSQGCMMALHLAPRLPEPLAGVVGMSGALLAPERLALDTRSRPPILLIHGGADPVVPAAALPLATAALTAAGFAVESQIYPGVGHGVSTAAIELTGTFLVKCLQSRLGPQQEV